MKLQFDQLDMTATKLIVIAKCAKIIHDNLQAFNNAAVDIHSSYDELTKIINSLPEIDFEDSRIAIERDIADMLSDITVLLNYCKRQLND